eukprot:5745577-Alexandrium_andersonii.AAC.1
MARVHAHARANVHAPAHGHARMRMDDHVHNAHAQRAHAFCARPRCDEHRNVLAHVRHPARHVRQVSDCTACKGGGP